MSRSRAVLILVAFASVCAVLFVNAWFSWQRTSRAVDAEFGASR